jgi:MOSC domain-containing protein YiiM
MKHTIPGPHIFQLNVSPGGVPKLAVAEAMLTAEGLAGDWQRNRRYHGGPRRAVCLYSLEAIVMLQREGHPIFPGSTGENITLAGLDLATLRPGSMLALGDEAVIEITDYAVPCRTISGSFRDGKSARVSHKRAPGLSRLYARVLHSGVVRPGLPVRVLQPANAQPDEYNST